MWQITIYQLIFGIISLCIIYIVGKLIVSFFDYKATISLRLFLINIIGITVIVFFFSIFKTKGKTILILITPILFFLLYFLKPPKTKNYKLHLSDILTELTIPLFVFTALFILQVIFAIDFNNFQFSKFWNDVYQFGFYSNSLLIYGNESRIPDMSHFFSHYREICNPYHYPELWLTSFFSCIYNNSTVNSFYFNTIPLLITTFILGVSAFIKSIKTWKAISISFFLIFFSGITISLFSVPTNTSWGIYEFIGQKLALVYCFVLLSFFCFYTKKQLIGLIILCTIPIFSITFFPSIYGGIALFILCLTFYNRDYKNNFMIFLLVIIQVLLFSLFYKQFGNIEGNVGLEEIFKNGIFKNSSSDFIQQSKIVISNFFVYSIPTIVIHLISFFIVYLFVFLLFARTTFQLRQLLLLCVCITIVGSTFTTLTSFLYNSNQFLYSCNVFLITISIIIFAKSTNNIFTKKIGFSFLVLGLLFIIIIQSFFSNISTKYRCKSNNLSLLFLKEIDNQIQEKNPLIMTFINKDDCINAKIFSTLVASNDDIHQLSQISNKRFVFTIGNPSLYLKYNKIRYFDDSVYFYHQIPLNYYLKNNKNCNLESFVKEYNITYFYFKSGTSIPSFLKNYKRITITNKTNSGVFISLQKSHL